MSIPSLNTLRRHAASQGYRLWKVPDGSALDWDYGPYTLTVAASNEVELRGVGLNELADFLERPRGLLSTGSPARGKRQGVRPGDDAQVPYSHLITAMPKAWTLDHLIRKHWSITNRSGYTARSVTFTTTGPLMISGRKDWKADIDQLEDGQGYAVTGTAGWSSTVNKPEIRVTWFSDDRAEEMKVATLRWPASAISFPGVPRQTRPTS